MKLQSSEFMYVYIMHNFIRLILLQNISIIRMFIQNINIVKNTNEIVNYVLWNIIYDFIIYRIKYNLYMYYDDYGW